MATSLSRRRFLQSTAAVSAAGVFVSGVEAAQPANERVRVAVIGVNAQGDWNIGQLAASGLAEIVALCDVDRPRSANVIKRFPKARFVEDYRRLMDDSRDFEAVLIATPDHHHAPAIMAALRNHKHVYCEKPLTHSVHEVRTVMETARRERVITQMGTQIHAGENYHRVVEIVRSGTLGAVRRVHVWNSGRPVAGFRVPKPAPVPAGLNYDLWLGPAPQTAYPPFRTGDNASPHFHWRWWWDFGGGVLADLACHYMDLPHWALNLHQPTSVQAQGRVTYKGDNTTPDVMQVDYEYPARGAQPPVHLTWYHGVGGPDLQGKITYPGFGSAILFEGEKGNLIADYGRYRLLPEDRFKGFEAPKPTLPRSPGHHREWLRNIRNNEATSCNFEYSGALTETVLLGNAAYRAAPNTKLQYDAKSGRLTGHADAERFLRRDYRDGWRL